MNPSTSSAIGDLYRQTAEDNLKILREFPVSLQSALLLTETMSPSDNALMNIKVKTAVSECLIAMRKISQLSAELDLMAEY